MSITIDYKVKKKLEEDRDVEERMRGQRGHAT